MGHTVQMHIHTTEDITEATTLVCFDDVVLVGKELAGQDKRGRPLCRFVIGCPDSKRLTELVDQHRSLPYGLQVGTKLYDARKREIITPAIQEIRELHQS